MKIMILWVGLVMVATGAMGQMEQGPIALGQLQEAANTNGVWERFHIVKGNHTAGAGRGVAQSVGSGAPPTHSKIGRWSAYVGISTNTPLTGTNIVRVVVSNYHPMTGAGSTFPELGRVTTGTVMVATAVGNSTHGWFDFYELSGTTNMVWNTSWSGSPTNSLFPFPLVYLHGQSATNTVTLNLEYVP